MAVTAAQDIDAVGSQRKPRDNVLIGLLAAVLILILAHAAGILPSWLHRLPEAAIPPTAEWLDAVFSFVQNDLGLIHFTRAIAGGLEYLLDATANLLYGKRRWPFLGPIPWTAIAVAGAVVGYYLGGWRLAALAVGTFAWTALVGQWKLAMQTMSVLVVAAPFAFLIGIMLGIAAWKYRWVDIAIKPILSILQTLPFFTYLLPAVIFFKVGPTAGAVATIVYAIPPMILMTTLGLKKVSPEVIEAGKMSGCTRWQMLTRVYLPAARTELLVGVNQVIMLCLAMVVLTAFIGMPGLGAKLLAMMGSFKIGRSFEIGITIVLLAIMLDRLSKAWVVKQPEHFERGTPWWQRHLFLLMAVGGFVLFFIAAQFIGILDEVGRKQSLSKGKEIDTAIKTFLDIDGVQAVTQWLRYFLNVEILIPFRNALLWIPTPAFVLAITAFAYWLGGRKAGIYGLIFFTIVAFSGWWDRSVITLYTVIAAVFLSMLIGIPLGIWASRGAGRPISLSDGPMEIVTGLLGLAVKRLPIALLALVVAGCVHLFSTTEQAFLSPSSASLWVLIAVFVALWWVVRRWPRDTVVLMIADSAQTFPSFIYLIPAIMLFGVNDVAVVFSILIFATVPLTRYTIEGMRTVPPQTTEAADMSGATRWQKLVSVQLPLALPTMAVGFNQAIMFAFFMVIIAAFIGTQDLGQELQRTLAGTDLGKNIVLGLNVSLMALTFDLAILAWAEKRKAALGLS